jgi:hypothetical protein
MTDFGSDSEQATTNKTRSPVSWILLACFAAGLIWFVVWPLANFLGRFRPGGYSERFVSPGRTVDLEACHRPGKGYLLHFIVRDQAGNEVDLIETRASTVMRFGVIWRGEGEFILDSSDIGCRRFRVGANGRWGNGELPERQYSQDGQESVEVSFHDGRIWLATNEHPWPDKSASTGGSGIPSNIVVTDIKPEHRIETRHGLIIVSDCLRWESPDVFSVDLATSRRYWRRASDGIWSEISAPPPSRPPNAN